MGAKTITTRVERSKGQVTVYLADAVPLGEGDQLEIAIAG
jgi:hypothetical protein